MKTANNFKIMKLGCHPEAIARMRLRVALAESGRLYHYDSVYARAPKIASRIARIIESLRFNGKILAL